MEFDRWFLGFGDATERDNFICHSCTLELTASYHFEGLDQQLMTTNPLVQAAISVYHGR
jgi:hypothetical protein